MKQLHLSTSAAEDLENILQYTLDNWGEGQFEKYLITFQQIFDSIQSDPGSPVFKKRDELFPECRSILAGHHVVFFRIYKKEIEVIRILHEKMDFTGHFQEEEE